MKRLAPARAHGWQASREVRDSLLLTHIRSRSPWRVLDKQALVESKRGSVEPKQLLGLTDAGSRQAKIRLKEAKRDSVREQLELIN